MGGGEGGGQEAFCTGHANDNPSRASIVRSVEASRIMDASSGRLAVFTMACQTPARASYPAMINFCLSFPALASRRCQAGLLLKLR